jgi:hypothetical protein
MELALGITTPLVMEMPAGPDADAGGAIHTAHGTVLWHMENEKGEAVLLEAAVMAYRAALTEHTQDRVPLDCARALGNEGVALLTLAGRTWDLARARQALEQLTLAETMLRNGGHIPCAEIFARQIPDAQALVDRLSGGPP